MKVSNHWSIRSCLPISIMLPMNKVLFWKKMLCCKIIIFHVLAKFCRVSILALVDKYSINSHDVLTSSATIIKDSFWFYFSSLL